MKLFVTIALICAFSIAAFAQTDAQKLENAKSLISQKKYASAYQVLLTLQQLSPDLILTGADVLLHHRVNVSDDYKQWALKDEPNGQPVRFNEDLENILWKGIAQWPTDCRLSNTAMELYAQVFDERDLYVDVSVLKGVGKTVENTILPKCPSHLSFFIAGYCNAEQGNFQLAIAQLQKSVSLNPNYAKSHLLLGRAYLQKKDFTNALKSAKTAYDLSTRRRDKSRAALVAGQAHEGLNENSNAFVKYNTADTLLRSDFFNKKALLKFLVKTNDSRASAMLSSFIGSQGRSSLHFYVDAYEIYAAYGKLAELATYCEKGLAQYKDIPGIISCLNFTLGNIYRTSNPALARQYLSAAKSQGIEVGGITDTRNHPNTNKMIAEAYKGL